MPERVLPNFAKVVDGRPVCLTCDEPLRKCASSSFWLFDLDNVQPYGWLGNSLFCSERHAAEWAVTKASVGIDA